MGEVPQQAKTAHATNGLLGTIEIPGEQLSSIQKNNC